MNFIAKDSRKPTFILTVCSIILAVLLSSCSKETQGYQQPLSSNHSSRTEQAEKVAPQDPDIKNSGDLAEQASACFRALDAEVGEEPVPYFPYISLEADKVQMQENTVVAPYEYTLYRYWTNERLDSDFNRFAAFRTNPVWTSDTVNLAAIIPVFSEESKRLFYADSGQISEPIKLTISDEDSYYSGRGEFLEKLAPEPEGGGGGPAASETLSRACEPMRTANKDELYPASVQSGGETDMEWAEGIYPFRNLISLFSGNPDEYAKLYDTYVLAYNTNHSEQMNLAVHIYSKDFTVKRVWMKADGKEVELKKSEYINIDEMNTDNWTLYDAVVSIDWFGQKEEAAQVFIELDSGEVKELHNR